MKKLAIFLSILCWAFMVLIGCSGAPTMPGDIPDSSQVISPYGPELNRVNLGTWEVVVENDGILTTRLIERDINPHFNVKFFLKPPKCYDCLTFSNVSNDPDNQILTADVTIKNPTTFSAADIRGIVISNNPEVYLVNADDYTTFWDDDDPADINPFRLFGKDLTDGIVEGEAEVTETFELHYDAIPFMFDTAADAIYPVDATREPYSIQDQMIDDVLDVNGSQQRTISMNIYDRNDDIGTVRVTNEALGIDIDLLNDGDNYYADVQNYNNAPAGDYDLLITAGDSVEPWFLYDYLTVTVVESIGEWVVDEIVFDNGGCGRDVGFGIDIFTGSTAAFTCGGTGCADLMISSNILTGTESYFNLEEIDELVPGFSPYPVTRLDSGMAGGVVFFSSSDEIYTDPFYTGPVSSLLVSVFPDFEGNPDYINPGDGDAGRMHPANSALKGVDVSSDISGNMYGLWADPDGVLPPEIYGLGPDYTRHDVFMGGEFPSELVGAGPGKISPVHSDLKALALLAFEFDYGILGILEYDGSTTEFEIIRFNIDYVLKITTFELLDTIVVSTYEGMDADILPMNEIYWPNPDTTGVYILLQGETGPFIQAYETETYQMVQSIGDSAHGFMGGTAASLEAENGEWFLLVTNQETGAAILTWVL